MKRTNTVAHRLVLALLAPSANALDTKPGATLSPGQFKTLVVETVFPFKVSRYEPPLPVNFVASDAMISHFSSMNAKDFAGNNETWTKDSLRDMAVRDKAS